VVEHGGLDAAREQRRPTICPKRPKPAMMTCALASTISSGCRSLVGAQRSNQRSYRISSTGVSAIESATASVSRASQSPGKSRAERATPNTTNANSPPCASSAESSQRCWRLTPMAQATAPSESPLKS
jgi:hypothetical protein